MNLEKKTNLDYKSKSEILNVLGDDIYKIKTYPTAKQLQEVAVALIETYHHLRENLGSGYDGWKISLTNKMKKMRQDFKETEEVKQNKATKRGRENKLVGPGKNAKRPLKGEVNWAPEIPQGEDDVSLERHRDFMTKEMKKLSHIRNENKIRAAMDATYAARRIFINGNPSLAEVQEIYPALFTTTEITAEYSRLMPGHNINHIMTSRLLTLGIPIISHLEKMKAAKKCAKFVAYSAEMNRRIKDQDEREKLLSYATMAAVFLPLLFSEDRELVQLVQEHAEGRIQTLAQSSVHPQMLVAGDIFDTELVNIAAEGHVLFECSEVTEGLICLFALYYVGNIEYPTKCRKTCAFVQHALMNVTVGQLPVAVINAMEKFKQHALPK